MAGEPAPSSHEPPRQWNQAQVTLIYQFREKNKEGGGGGVGEKDWSKGYTKGEAARKRCTKHKETMQTSLTALKPTQWPLTNGCAPSY